MTSGPKHYAPKPIWQMVIQRPRNSKNNFPLLPGSDPAYGSFQIAVTSDKMTFKQIEGKKRPDFIHIEYNGRSGYGGSSTTKVTLAWVTGMYSTEVEFPLRNIEQDTEMTITLSVIQEKIKSSESQMDIIRSLQKFNQELEDSELALELECRPPQNNCANNNDRLVRFYCKPLQDNPNRKPLETYETRCVRASLLADNIDYFRALFSFQSMTENIYLTGISACSLDILVNFLISGRKIITNERHDYLVELFQFAQMAVIPDVQIAILRKAIAFGDVNLLKNLLCINMQETSPLSSFMQRHILAQLT